MTQDEALKLALEALEDRSSLMKWQEARDAVKEALAQPKQEPVAWRWENAGEDKWLNKYQYLDNGVPDYPEECEPLYTTPPQRTWVELTDEEVRGLWSWSATSEAEKTANTQQHAFARAIEAKLKEKNT